MVRLCLAFEGGTEGTFADDEEVPIGFGDAGKLFEEKVRALLWLEFSREQDDAAVGGQVPFFAGFGFGDVTGTDRKRFSVDGVEEAIDPAGSEMAKKSFRALPEGQNSGGVADVVASMEPVNQVPEASAPWVELGVPPERVGDFELAGGGHRLEAGAKLPARDDNDVGLVHLPSFADRRRADAAKVVEPRIDGGVAQPVVVVATGGIVAPDERMIEADTLVLG